MKLPGPDHPITITPNAKRVRVTADGVEIFTLSERHGEKPWVQV